MGECVIGAIKSSLHFVFQMCRLLFDAFRRPIRLPENLSLQIKQYLLVLCRSGEIGNGVRAFG